jgi:hypothetical protein
MSDKPISPLPSGVMSRVRFGEIGPSWSGQVMAATALVGDTGALGKRNRPSAVPSCGL